ncbi:hypothetical protein LMG33818_000059 [Halomonadaceae bacterium LMG 33818]|uniref:hypothetical protein n=1 Tax=Cernens ardua TaxID=3402176 RepID=UPI003EDC4183
MDKYSSNMLPHDDAGTSNSMIRMVRDLVGANKHIVPCYVTNNSEVDQKKTISVMPIIQGLTGNGLPIDNVEITDIPVMRNQAGDSAIIINPHIGDVGLLLVSDKDISNITGPKQAIPGNVGRFTLSNALYLGSIPLWCDQEPEEYVQLSGNGSGISIKTPGTLSIEAEKPITINARAGLTINGNVTVNGNVTAEGEVTGNKIPLSKHVHSGVTAGNSPTGTPEA